MVQHAANGRIRSIDRVRQELERGKDALASWAGTHFSDAFVSSDETEVVQSFAEIMSWVQGQSQYSDAAKTDFANVADGWLVAYARAKRCVIVTHEEPAPDARRKVPIPNVCRAFNVRFVDTFDMLRNLGVRFV